jgi:protein involved in polysaccharide export with SLBB domain
LIERSLGRTLPPLHPTPPTAYTPQRYCFSDSTQRSDVLFFLSRLFRAGFCVALACSLLAPHARAQSSGDALSAVLSARSGVQPGLASEFAQEGVIDADRYLVGPGDVFVLSIGGAQPVQLQLPVTADGQIVLPDVGAVEISGQTLRAARARIQQALQPLYRNVPVAAALAQPRRFAVHVSGAAELPGRRVVTPLARLSDAVQVAEPAERPLAPPSALSGEADIDLLQPAEVREETVAPRFQPNLRAVVIRRADGSAQSYDLARYLRTGDLDYNPYLQDGDRIFVPTYHTTRDVAFVSGDVALPDAYPVRADDTASDVIALAGGLPSGASVRVLQASGEVSTSLDVLVDAGATIYVERDRRAGIVEVEGEVAYPGSYRIVSGQTTARQALDQAGGLLPTALVRGAYIERAGVANAPAGTARTGRSAAQRSIATPGDLPFVTRASFVEQLEAPTLGLPGVTWIEGDARVPLYDGDRIVIPRDDETILVTGGVARPGYFPMQSGASASAYIAAAGGLRRSVRDVLVLRSGTDELVEADQAGVLRSGDVVLVVTDEPATQSDLYRLALQERTLEMQAERDRREARFRTITTVTAVVGTVASIVTTYLLITTDRDSGGTSN